MKDSFAGQVWETLHNVNVNERVEKKGNLSYLSWAWAWGVLMEHYPESVYTFREPVDRHDGTCEVWVDLTIKEGDKEVSRAMWLPAMDNRNAAIKNPDARKISDTRMRCLTKAISMFGLGHYIYAGEDLPQSDLDEVKQGFTKEQRNIFLEFVECGQVLDLWLFRKDVGDEIYSALHGSFDSGAKVSGKKRVAEMEAEVPEKFAELSLSFAACIDEGDEQGVHEFSEYHPEIKKALFAMLNPEQQHKLNEIKKAA